MSRRVYNQVSGRPRIPLPIKQQSNPPVSSRLPSINLPTSPTLPLFKMFTMAMSPFSRPSTPESDYPPSPRSILEEYFMDIEDIQDIDAISITSSVSSSISTTSQKVFQTFLSGQLPLVHHKIRVTDALQVYPTQRESCRRYWFQRLILSLSSPVLRMCFLLDLYQSQARSFPLLWC